ncbi:MAG: hypothetical protein GY774_30435 [Planctomycetes bacterium]|nr:hypothetical protein [Planctomycetota bacterium]
MKIQVQIGSEEQKQLIKNELSSLKEVAEEFQPPLNIAQLIVPEDFDKTVNEIQGTESYKSVRTHFTVGKIVDHGDTITVVFSPWLYTQGFDHQVRMSFYMHELLHSFNKRRRPVSQDSAKIPIYYDNIYILFDEYYSDRKAFEIVDNIFNKKTSIFLTYIDETFAGFLQSVSDKSHYDNITEQIDSFRSHGDVDIFLRNINETFDGVSKGIVHAYSYMDHYAAKLGGKEDELLKCKFINNKTISLIKYFRIKYLQNSFDLLDGMDLIEPFMTNFGMRFELIPNGVYCHIIDI